MARRDGAQSAASSRGLCAWIQEGPITERLADFGLALLFFMAGNEIDFRVLRGRNGARAVGGWLIGLISDSVSRKRE